jgi:hypothetical protein
MGRSTATGSGFCPPPEFDVLVPPPQALSNIQTLNKTQKGPAKADLARPEICGRNISTALNKLGEKYVENALKNANPLQP